MEERRDGSGTVDVREGVSIALLSRECTRDMDGCSCGVAILVTRTTKSAKGRTCLLLAWIFTCKLQ